MFDKLEFAAFTASRTLVPSRRRAAILIRRPLITDRYLMLDPEPLPDLMTSEYIVMELLSNLKARGQDDPVSIDRVSDLLGIDSAKALKCLNKAIRQLAERGFIEHSQDTVELAISTRLLKPRKTRYVFSRFSNKGKVHQVWRRASGASHRAQA